MTSSNGLDLMLIIVLQAGQKHEFRMKVDAEPRWKQWVALSSSQQLLLKGDLSRILTATAQGWELSINTELHRRFQNYILKYCVEVSIIFSCSILLI